MTFHNLLESLPLLLLAIFVLIIVRKLTHRQTPVWKLPPGPPKHPVIGNLHQLGEILHQSLARLTQKHGPIMHLKLGHVSTVVVSSSELAKQVLKTYDLDCCSRPPLVGSSKLSYGCSEVAFGPYGQMWKELRKICNNELFSNKKIYSPFFRSVREEEVDKTMTLIASHASSLLPVNLSGMLSSLTSCIICRIAFGKNYAKDLLEVHDIMKDMRAVFGGFFFEDYFPAIGRIADILAGTHGRLQRTFKKLDKFYQQLMEDHTRAARNKETDDGDTDTLDVLLQLQGDNKYLTDDCIKGLLMDILFGGTDTSSTTVAWTMTELMRQPKVMKKAQDEVRRCIGRGKRIVEESDLDKLSYTKAVIKETMRKYPPAPLLVPRETMHHIKLNGYDIPPKTVLIINAWYMGRDPSLWENPEEFYPERFIEANEYDFKLIPFGEGRRICPGRNLGLIAVELVIANLLYCFDWNFPSGMTKENIDMEEAPGLVLDRKSDLWLLPKTYDGKEV